MVKRTVQTVTRATSGLMESLGHRRALVLITASGFLVRIGWALHASPIPVSDFNDYRTLALDMLDHLQFGYPNPTVFFLPMHPTYLAIFASVSRADFWLSFATVLASTASIPLMWSIGRQVVGTHRAGLIAGGIFAFFPTFVAFSPVLATEHLFITLVLGAIVLLTRSTGEGRRGLIPAGILTGLAVLTRGETVFYLPAIIAWIAVGQQKWDLRRSMRATLVFGGAVAVVVLPWFIRNSLVSGPETGLSASAGMNFYFAHNDSGTYGDFVEGNEIYGLPPEEAGPMGWRLGLEHIRAHPLNLVIDIWKGTKRLFAAPDYAVFWPTQGAEYYGDPEFYQREVVLAGLLRRTSAASTVALIVIASLSVLLIRSWTRPFALLIVPLAVSSWGLRTILYWAKPRYAYFLTVMLVVAATVVLHRLVASGE